MPLRGKWEVYLLFVLLGILLWGVLLATLATLWLDFGPALLDIILEASEESIPVEDIWVSIQAWDTLRRRLIMKLVKKDVPVRVARMLASSGPGKGLWEEGERAEVNRKQLPAGQEVVGGQESVDLSEIVDRELLCSFNHFLFENFFFGFVFIIYV